MLVLASDPVLAAAGRGALAGAEPSLAKVSSRLLRAKALSAAGRADDEIRRTVPGVRVTEGRLEVQVRLETLDAVGLELLRAAGLHIGSAHPAYALAYGRIAPDRLGELAAVPGVATIHPRPRVGRRTAGSVANQADVTLRADQARMTLGVDGSGVTVGILSDSFNDGLGGTVSGGACACATPGSTCATAVTGMANQASGDLPGSIPLLDDCTSAGAVPGDPCFGLSDEGAAIGELIFDLAPGADFMFHSAFNSPSDFAGGITELANCGADVIVDDVFWTEQPFFQDGEIAQAAQAAVDAGVPYFSAAGNDAGFGVNDDFTDFDGPSDDSAFPPTGDDFHDFGGGDRFAAITIPDDCSIYAELQWSEPFDGALGPGAASDLDLYLLSTAAVPDAGLTNVIDLSTNATGCGANPAATGCADGICGDPVESIFHFNSTGANETVFLTIEHFCGDQSVEVRMVTIGFDCGLTTDHADADPSTGFDFEDGVDFVSGLPVADGSETPIFTDAQIFGHPAAEGVLAVAAAFYGEVDSNGTVDPPTTPGALDVEPFSSLGGDLPFYFDAAGSPLGPIAAPLGPVAISNETPPAPETRFKPEITAPDGTNNTFFGADIGFDMDLDPNFFGTSAAAPHAAAVAALMQELGNLTPSGLRQVLVQSTIDLEAPLEDGLSGFGLIDALNGVGTIVPSSASCFIDDLELEGKTNTGAQTFRACNSLTVGNGDFSDVTGIADEIIFADGFESGDTSAWGPQ